LRYNLDSLLYGYGTAIVRMMLLHHVQVVNLMLFEAGLCVPIFPAYTISAGCLALFLFETLFLYSVFIYPVFTML